MGMAKQTNKQQQAPATHTHTKKKTLYHNSTQSNSGRGFEERWLIPQICQTTFGQGHHAPTLVLALK